MNTTPRWISDTLKECSACEARLPHDQFYSWTKGGVGNKHLSWYCKECTKTKARQNHNAKKNDSKYQQIRRNAYYKTMYGVTRDELNVLFKKQLGSCGICGILLEQYGSKTHLDHCHTTNKIRGFLCTNCNRGIGHLQESVEILKSAIAYIQKHSEFSSEKEGIGQ